jgi:hypothetical protein
MNGLGLLPKLLFYFEVAREKGCRAPDGAIWQGETHPSLSPASRGYL